MTEKKTEPKLVERWASDDTMTQRLASTFVSDSWRTRWRQAWDVIRGKRIALTVWYQIKPKPKRKKGKPKPWDHSLPPQPRRRR